MDLNHTTKCTYCLCGKKKKKGDPQTIGGLQYLTVRVSRQKINKISELNHTLGTMGLTVIYRKFHPTVAKLPKG